MRLVLLLALAVILSPASAQTFPKFTGLVVDEANVLPPDRRAALQTKLEAFQQRTQRQLVVATIPDLQGYPIEDYGYRLGRTWGVGLQNADNGIILIVAPKDRKVRIEVGRRLEPVMTDALSSIIIRERILPAFKSGDMAGGIKAGADAVIAQLSAPDDQAKAEAAKAAVAFDREHKRASSGGGGAPLGLIFWGFVVLFVILAMRRGRSGAKGPWGQQRYRSQDGNGWVWLWAASEILNQATRNDHASSSWRGSDSGGWGGGGGSDGGWGGGGFTGGGGGDFGGGGASGDW